MRWWLILLLAPIAGCLGAPGDVDDSTPATVPPPPEGQADPALSQTGRWLAPFDGEVPAVNMVLLHDGRILYWSGVEARDDGDATSQVFFTAAPFEGDSRLLEFANGTFSITTPGQPGGDAGDLFCAGQTILPDGRVLTSGGTEWHNVNDPSGPFLDGIKDTRIFDPASNNWTRVEDMVLGRWYPSMLTLPDGTPVAASGIASLSDPQDHWPNWESYNADDNRWELLQGTLDHLLPLYPRLHVVPGGSLAGHALFTTAGTMWGPFGEHPQQSEWSYMKSYNSQDDTWHEHGMSQFGARNYATSIMTAADASKGYAAKIVSFGGTLQQSLVATNLAEVIEIGGDPTTRRVADMNQARWNHNSVLLPDGDILTIGGGAYDNVILHGQQNIPVLAAESFDPETESWSPLAEMTVPRMYHSSAILLPDATILAGGHVPLPNPSEHLRDAVNPQVAETRLEIYEPGYLFRGARPIIYDTPESISYGDIFEIEVATTAPIDSVMLVHPGATTHAFDSNQRGTWLKIIEQDGNTVRLEAPPSGVVTPPGHHMLFVNQEHAEGPVPSVAAWIHVSD